MARRTKRDIRDIERTVQLEKANGALLAACRKALNCVSNASDFRQAHEIIGEMVEILQAAIATATGNGTP